MRLEHHFAAANCTVRCPVMEARWWSGKCEGSASGSSIYSPYYNLMSFHPSFCHWQLLAQYPPFSVMWRSSCATLISSMCFQLEGTQRGVADVAGDRGQRVDRDFKLRIRVKEGNGVHLYLFAVSLMSTLTSIVSALA